MAQIIIMATADGSKQRGFPVPDDADLDRLFRGLIRFARFMEAEGYLRSEFKLIQELKEKYGEL